MDNDNERNAFDDVGDSLRQATDYAVDFLRMEQKADQELQNASFYNASDSSGIKNSDSVGGEVETQHFSSSDNPESAATSFSNEATQEELTNKIQTEAATTATQNAAKASEITSGAAATSSASAFAASAEAEAGAVATDVAVSAGAEAAASAGAEAAAGAGAEAAAGAGASAAGAGAAAEGATAVAGAAGPVGWLAGAAVAVATKTSKKAGQEFAEITGDTDTSGGFFIMLVVSIILLLLISAANFLAPAFYLYSAVSDVVNVISEVGENVNAYFDEQSKEAFFEDLLDVQDASAIINNQQTFNEESSEIYKKIIDYAIYKAFKDYVWDLMIDLPTQMDLGLQGYSSVASYYKFVHAPYPYKLRSNDGEYITVGYYLKHHDEIVNDDLNYAEVLAVISQSETFSIDNFTYSELYDLLMSDETVSHLFELEITDTAYTTDDATADIDTITEINDETLDELDHAKLEEVEEPSWLDMAAEKLAEWWLHRTWHFDVNLYPMGLQELYDIAGVDYYSGNKTIYSKTNIELLDQTELWIRELCPNVDMGPAYNKERSNRSIAYAYIYATTEGRNTVPTGRSAISYTDNSLINNVIEGLTYAQAYCQTRLHPEARTVPVGSSVILDMYGLIDQTQQSGYRGTWNGKGVDNRSTISHSGCIDCCYVMVYEYFHRRELNLQSICASYVDSGDNFMWGNFRNDFDLPGNWSKQTYSAEKIKRLLGNGTPVIFFIDGRWEYGGKVYHASDRTHYIVIMGYDVNGFYVYDPGGKQGLKNTTEGPIPYEAFYKLSNRSFREFDVPSGCSVSYKVNTLSEE